jgi:hypothetical protein
MWAAPIADFIATCPKTKSLSCVECRKRISGLGEWRDRAVVLGPIDSSAPSGSANRGVRRAGHQRVGRCRALSALSLRTSSP